MIDTAGRDVGADKPLKILVIAPFFSHESTSNRPLLLSEVLTHFGKVDIVTTSFDHQTKVGKAQFQFTDGRVVYYLPTFSYRKNFSLSRFFSHFCFSFRVWFFYLLHKDKYDVVYCTLPLNLTALLVFIISSKKVKILDVVDIWPDVLPFPSIFKNIFFPLFTIWRWTYIFSIRSCDVLLTVSDRFMSDSIPYFRYQKSNAKRFYIGSKRLSLRSEKSYGLPTIVYVGNIGYLYDFETLLMSMEACQSRLRFSIVGDGNRKDWLLSELERRGIEYHYYGVVYDDDKLGDILSKCDIGFNGYRNTSAAFSYKANTYFAARLPILNSMGGDLRDLVSECGLGFNYMAGDVDSLTGCINKLLSEDMSLLSQNVAKFFESEIDREVIKCNISKFLSENLS